MFQRCRISVISKLDELAQLVEIDAISQLAGCDGPGESPFRWFSAIKVSDSSLNEPTADWNWTKDGTILNPTEGNVALRRQDADTIQPAIDFLEELTNQLVFQ